MIRFIATMLLLTSAAAHSETVTLDLEEFYGSVSTFEPLTKAVTQNYRFTAAPNSVYWFTDPPFGSTVSMFIDIGDSLTLQAVNGQVFDLLGFDYSFNGETATRDLSVSITNSLGQMIDYSVSLTGDYNRYSYDALGLFDDIVSVTFTNAADTLIALDDFVVTAAVPVPAAVWLFGSALAGLGWIRRRKLS